MMQHTMSDLWLLFCTLAFLGVVVRAYLPLWKRIGVKALGRLVPGTLPYYAFRVIATGIAAVLLAQFAPDDPGSLVFLALWMGLFLLWKYWDGGRAAQAGISSPDLHPRLNQPSSFPQLQDATRSAAPAALPKPKRPTVIRTLGRFAAGVVLLLLASMLMVIGALTYYHHQAESEHDKIHLGMTAEQVLSAVQNYFILAAYSDAPASGPGDTSHSITLTIDSNGLLHTYDLSSRQPRVFSAQAAAELMREKLGDGCEWHWRYTFVNDTPQHISFSVIFGRDGRVKELKPVYGWD